MKKVILGLFILGSGFIIQGILKDPSLNQPQAAPSPLSSQDIAVSPLSPQLKQPNQVSSQAALLGFLAREILNHRLDKSKNEQLTGAL